MNPKQTQDLTKMDTWHVLEITWLVRMRVTLNTVNKVRLVNIVGTILQNCPSGDEYHSYENFQYNEGHRSLHVVIALTPLATLENK